MLPYLNSCCSSTYPASYPVNTEGSFLGIKPTTCLHLMLRLQLQGAIPPLPYTPSWYSAYETQEQLYFYMSEFKLKIAKSAAMTFMLLTTWGSHCTFLFHWATSLWLQSGSDFLSLVCVILLEVPLCDI